MQKLILNIHLFFFCCSFAYAQAPFVTVWQTDNAGGVTGSNQIRIPAAGQFTYTWECVASCASPVTGSGAGNNATIVTFPSAGTYRVSMTPASGSSPFNRILFGGAGDRTKIIDVEQWGDVTWQYMHQAFEGTTHLIHITAQDTPDLSAVPHLNLMFRNSGIATVNNINNWNTSNITSLNQMFSGASSFNSPIGNWDVSNVESFTTMFYQATSFNQPIGDWDVSGGTRFDGMFQEAIAFNQPLNNWRFNTNPATPVALNGLFFDALSFNQPLNDWNTGNVNRMGGMFRGALGQHAFNQDLSNWDLSSIPANTGNASDFIFSNASMDCINYSATLIGWANNPNTPDNIRIGNATGAVYSPAGQAARDYLITTKGWTISGDMFDPGCGPLPVKLISFEARKQDQHTLLTWKTASETNNSHFEVEHSTDAIHFTTLGRVEGKGTTVAEQEYSWLHPTPAQGLNYYRLKQVDHDGTSDYSVIRAVNADGVFIAYPNPAQDYVVLSGVAGASSVEIVDIRGIVKVRRSHVKEAELTLDTSSYAPGTYVVRMVKNGQVETRKISIKQ